MDIEAVLSKVAPTPAEQARKLGVSDGHIADLKSGRRDLSIPLAVELERLTQETGLVDAVVANTVAKKRARDAA